MLSTEPLNEEEKRHLNALKLFFEASGHEESAKHLDELPPNAQRYMINLYHLWLEDRRAFSFAQKITHWLVPIIRPYFCIREFLEKLFRRSR